MLRPVGLDFGSSSGLGSPTGRKHKAAGVLRLGPVWRARAVQAFGRAPNGPREGSRGSHSGAGMRRRATAETKARTRGRGRAIRGGVSLGPWRRTVHGAALAARLRAANVAPGNIVLSRQDKFDGIEFGQPQAARRAKAREGLRPRSSPSGARTRFKQGRRRRLTFPRGIDTTCQASRSAPDAVAASESAPRWRRNRLRCAGFPAASR